MRQGFASRIRRRAVLAMPAAFLMRPADAPVLDPLPAGRILLRLPSADQGLTLPASRARHVAVVRLAGQSLAAVAFAADPDGDTTIDLLALATLAKAKPPRLIGLEILRYADADGVRLATQFSAASDGSCLVLSRAASQPRLADPVARSGLVERSAWTDYLVWSDGAPLDDRPVHPPKSGSWQALLAQRRRRVRVTLGADLAEITPSFLRDTTLLRPLRP